MLNRRPTKENAAGSGSYSKRLHQRVEALQINEKYAHDRATGKSYGKTAITHCGV